MKAQVKIPDSAVQRPVGQERAPASPPAVDARVAANDELHTSKRHAPENPLWAINIAMAAFFIVTALVMMTS